MIRISPETRETTRVGSWMPDLTDGLGIPPDRHVTWPGSFSGWRGSPPGWRGSCPGWPGPCRVSPGWLWIVSWLARILSWLAMILSNFSSGWLGSSPVAQEPLLVGEDPVLVRDDLIVCRGHDCVSSNLHHARALVLVVLVPGSAAARGVNPGGDRGADAGDRHRIALEAPPTGVRHC